MGAPGGGWGAGGRGPAGPERAGPERAGADTPLRVRVVTAGCSASKAAGSGSREKELLSVLTARQGGTAGAADEPEAWPPGFVRNQRSGQPHRPQSWREAFAKQQGLPWSLHRARLDAFPAFCQLARHPCLSTVENSADTQLSLAI